MPIYEYTCTGCGIETEILQKMEDPPPMCNTSECSMKGLPQVRRVSTTTFTLVGSGWAKDGYGG